MSTSTPRTYHRGDLGTALVDSALELLPRLGAGALSLRAVARHAGVSAMAPYRHFPDREALLAAVAVRGFDALRDALRAADAAAAPGGALTAQAIAYVRFAADHPALFRLMFGPVRKRVNPGLLAAGDTAYAVLARRVRLDRPGEDHEMRALGCWALVHGLAGLFLDGVIGAEPGSEDAVTAAVASAMLGGGQG